MAKKIAYFDSSHDMPEEIISAAGFVPYKILGDVHESNDPADRFLQNFICPASRSWLTEALKKASEWEGIMFAHGCDATNRQYDIWKMHVETPFMYWFNSPMNQNETAAKFFKKELKLMVEALEEQFDVEITKEKMQNAIKESNDVKRKLKELSSLRGEKDVSNRDYFDALVKCVQLPKKQALSDLDQILSDWKKRDEFPSDMKKVLLTGSDVTYGEWMDIMEESGLRVVRDDLSIGERYYANLIPETTDPVDALQEYYFNIPRPATKNPPDSRLDYLFDCMEESNLDGVVSQNLKFCEPYAFDFFFTVNGLKDKGYKVIHLEREFSPSVDHQLITRLEAFREMLV